MRCVYSPRHKIQLLGRYVRLKNWQGDKAKDPPLIKARVSGHSHRPMLASQLVVLVCVWCWFSDLTVMVWEWDSVISNIKYGLVCVYTYRFWAASSCHSNSSGCGPVSGDTCPGGDHSSAAGVEVAQAEKAIRVPTTKVQWSEPRLTVNYILTMSSNDTYINLSHKQCDFICTVYDIHFISFCNNYCEFVELFLGQIFLITINRYPCIDQCWFEV